MQVVVFKLNDQEFAFHIQSVKEIIKITAITHVPNAQESVQGIINLRGMVTPIINLAERFGFKEKPTTEHSRIIILNIFESTVGVIVDSVSEVLMFKDEDILAPGDEPLVLEKFIHGIGMLDDRLLILLKPEEILGGISQSA
ncbi:CheW protein [Desulfitobacterium sp. LBE]|uniref:CheW-like domain-containing protein n=5 Tax=root TaxID=1 RepID=Q24R12_DESHY|nr:MULTISPECIES: chemotaxis protein CheW [Desulfitobacterium]ACL19659.1 CheW protein [Desulfitobacterium hafniense DCB-2]EHL08351.1 CheW-like protein [Desulfitobacterium hafniense DP7]KTE89654.1 chemotaxis protein CheW [Desulfitobacterium hafniense]MEA5024482.1 chemotaxis protein CheW [Desulfitobacterium hafniense]TWH57491.1 CheW protein [Desulfitobacterium sp. LBE]